MKGARAICIFWIALLGFALAEEPPESGVGMRKQLTQVIISGSEVEVKPIESSATPMIIRITETYPGTEFRRYDLEYYALDPGTYNLLDYLQRKDGTAMGELDPITVKVIPRLPPGQIQPSELEDTAVPKVGGYRQLMKWAIGLWIVGLAAIILWRKPRAKSADAEETRPLTFSEQLRPLVESARRGDLSDPERARLERMLLSYWRKRLGLETSDPAAAIAELRQHPEAGPLLRKLEEWLHRPPGQAEPVDLEELLAPYENLEEQPA